MADLEQSVQAGHLPGLVEREGLGRIGVPEPGPHTPEAHQPRYLQDVGWMDEHGYEAAGLMAFWTKMPRSGAIISMS